MRIRYKDELHKIMSNDTPAPPTTRTREQIESDIAEISEMLRGSLSNAERLNMVEDRFRLRKQLAAMV